MDGQGGGAHEQRAAAELRARLDRAQQCRLVEAVRLTLAHAFEVIDRLQLQEPELDAFLQFLTEVGYATDARRQEWVLLADVMGVSDCVMNRSSPGNPKVTPSTLPGPFYRPDAPRLPLGANLCRNDVGEPLSVTGRVTATDGTPIAGAEVEVWHANAEGRYENQDPDNQPEHNLRGRFIADDGGRFHFSTVRPGGYALPDDGPVGQLIRRLGLSLDRPAHIHFAVSAPGFRRLVTAVFDHSDPAIDRDALFAVKPDLIGRFHTDRGGLSLDVALILDRGDGSLQPFHATIQKEG